jgi:selenoprotein W-related protein
MVQELLNTFSQVINELKLVPSSGGVFEIYVNDKLIWSRKDMEGFPEIKKLKQLVRDEIAPEMDLGHTDS